MKIAASMARPKNPTRLSSVNSIGSIIPLRLPCSKASTGACSDSVKCHPPIRDAADRRPVVTARETCASCNGPWRAESIENGMALVIFQVGGNTAAAASGWTPEERPTRGKAHGGDQLVFGERATNQ